LNDVVHLDQRLTREISKLKGNSRYRSLSPSFGIDFTSNDYLGLAHSEALRIRVTEYLSKDIPLSSSGSRLLRGNHPEHELLERRFAEFLSCEVTLFFNSGYDANFALLTTLPTRHDTILLDSLVHASLKEGAHASVAEKRTFEHNSLASLRQVADNMRTSGDTFVVIESIYSMDGDESPLAEIASFCVERGFVLIVDEAHGTGVLGQNGRGLIDELGLRSRVNISVHTCGKALGSAGGIVASNQLIKEYLINKARPFIYTTALPPIIPLQTIAALDLLEERGDLLAALHSNIASVRKTLTASLRNWRVIEGRSPIIAVIVGDDSTALNAARYLQSNGLDVRAIRPPTVPAGTARLRITIHADHTEAEIMRLCDSLIQAEAVCKG
jgi:8-amino-7-oxononanoate synthase